MHLDAIFPIVEQFMFSLELRHAILAFLFFLFIQTVLAIRHDQIFRRTMAGLEKRLGEKIDAEVTAIREDLRKLKEGQA